MQELCCKQNGPEEGDQWILWVLSKIPRSVYYGGGDLSPRVQQTGTESNRERKKNARSEKHNFPTKTKASLSKAKTSLKSDNGTYDSQRNNQVETKSMRNDKNNTSQSSPDAKDIPENNRRIELQGRIRELVAQHRRDRKADGTGLQSKGSGRDKRSLKEKRSESRKNSEKNRDKVSEVESDNRGKSRVGSDDANIKLSKVRKDEGTKINGKSNATAADAAAIEVTDSASKIAVETTRLAGLGEDDGGNAKKGRPKKRRKLGDTKLKELQSQLAVASKERELREEADKGLGSTDENIQHVVQKREIEKALQRAKGERPKDDVSKLRKSIRKEKRKKEKSKEEWAKRVEAVEKEKATRQERREKNLKERSEAKKARTSGAKKTSKFNVKKGRISKGGKGKKK